ncbi:MAG: DUF1993 domain-containing protein [Proteobacteria bacterium]|nr:DUF1993 domain-containing protein [Pseudomonadota bacterium]
MALSMYTASVPQFTRILGNLVSWFAKAEAHAEAKKFDPSVYFELRLAPDMLAFAKQVQIACDTVKFAVARLSDVEAPKFEDNEKTFAELRQRVQRTLDYIQSVPADKIDGTDAKEVTLPRRDGPLTMTGEAYLQRFVLPNFFFHATMTYALLRQAGVDLGKMDFLGALK